MIKVRLQAAHVVRLNPSRLCFCKGTLHGDIGSCNQDDADQGNYNNSGSRFGHGLYTPCQSFLPDEGTFYSPCAGKPGPRCTNWTQLNPTGTVKIIPKPGRFTIR